MMEGMFYVFCSCIFVEDIYNFLCLFFVFLFFFIELLVVVYVIIMNRILIDFDFCLFLDMKGKIRVYVCWRFLSDKEIREGE